MDNKLKFTIITPTTGNNYLRKLLWSINNLKDNKENYNIEHVIVIDGNKFKDNAMKILNDIDPVEYVTRHITQLAFNSGANGYLCRIFTFN
jgi:hypothetical protein